MRERKRILPLGLLAAWLVLNGGCASFTAYRIAEPLPYSKSGSAHYLEKVLPVAQGAYQCGPAALESVVHYWGGEAKADSISQALYKSGSRGVLNFTLAGYARDMGFWTQMPETDAAGLRQWLVKGVPPVVLLSTGILWVSNYHFVVLKGFDEKDRVFYANIGKPDTYAIPYLEFDAKWKDAGRWCLVVCPPERVDWELDDVQAADLGFLLERLGRLDLAVQRYSAALNKNPKNPTVRFNLANIYRKTGRSEEAKKIYAELIKERPDWSGASNNLAWICLEEGRYRDAITVIETAFRSGAPRNFDILDTLGLAFRGAGDTASAKAHFLEAVDKVPSEDVEALRLIKEHLKECGSAG